MSPWVRRQQGSREPAPVGPGRGSPEPWGRSREVRGAGRLDGYGEMEEPDGASHAVLLGVSTWQPAGTKGLPPTGLRGLRQDRSPPHLCDASRARPSSGRDAQGYSPDDTPCQEQSENIALHLTPAPPPRHPLPRPHRARPGDPDGSKHRASPDRDGRDKPGHDGVGDALPGSCCFTEPAPVGPGPGSPEP